MAIAASDIKLRISGSSASATDPNGSYGGAMSTVSGGIITTNVLNNDIIRLKFVTTEASIRMRWKTFLLKLREQVASEVIF